MEKSKDSVILSVIHHRQNHLESTCDYRLLKIVSMPETGSYLLLKNSIHNDQTLTTNTLFHLCSFDNVYCDIDYESNHIPYKE
jgi:hypothetical protein